ncbi:hypothetical protein RRG08_012129 [Elysia crispata]|uniref:Cadherin domain-containing protein n=1 Tax=Elysia crispata TaxID=231223 RepID=A0AAE1AMM8_9GAST|nr:hypothetical protein RRG08_012129 [Elysia crispata]
MNINGSVEYTANFILVSDADGLTDSTTLVISIKDANDNDPEFSDLDQYFTVSSCNVVGSNLGTVVATDLDSDFQDNNVISYSKSSGSSMVTITPGGDIILNSIPDTGTSETFTVVATDHGVYPGTLSSVVSATVTVAGIDCTSTTTTTTTAASVTTTTAATTTDGSNAGNDDENVPWIILAALFGLVFVALTVWLCLTRALPFCGPGKFSPRWIRSCQCNNQKCCQRRRPRVKVRPAKPRPLKPQVQPPSGNPGFWTERFHDDNYPFKDPDRDRLPEPANYDRLPNTYQNTYNQEQGIPQLRPDSAPRALGEPTYREYNDATLDMKNTARIWSTEEFSTFGPPQYRAQNYNYGYNNDAMDGIL